MFWLGNNKIIFYLHTIWRPVKSKNVVIKPDMQGSESKRPEVESAPEITGPWVNSA